LVAQILKKQLPKDLQKSNWGRYVLTREQIRYAAADAVACALLYKRLSSLENWNISTGTLVDKSNVSLWTKNGKTLVATGIIDFSIKTIEGFDSKKQGRVPVRILSIKAPSVLIEYDDPSLQQISIGSFEPGSNLCFFWDIRDVHLEVISNIPRDLNEGEKFSGVCLDIVHMFFRISSTLSKKHGLYSVFLSRFTDAIFKICPEDTNEYLSRLRQSGLDESNIKHVLSNEFRKVRKSVRRYVPEPSELVHRVNAVINLFGDAKDHKSGQSLFTKKTWDEVKKAMVHIEKGCLSDRHGDEMYYISGTRPDGSLLYKTFRGTSMIEGYHRTVRLFCNFYNATPYLAVAILRILNFRHNVRTMYACRTSFRGNFFSHWLLFDFAKKHEQLFGTSYEGEELLPDPAAYGFSFTENLYFLHEKAETVLNEYSPAFVDDEETEFACDEDEGLPTSTSNISADLHEQDPDNIGLLENDFCADDDFDEEEDERLEEDTQQELDVRPVLTEEERILFSEIYLDFASSNASNCKTFIDFSRMAVEWNSNYANESQNIYPKTAYLLSYYRKKSDQELNRNLSYRVIQSKDSVLLRSLRTSTANSATLFPPAMLMPRIARTNANIVNVGPISSNNNQDVNVFEEGPVPEVEESAVHSRPLGDDEIPQFSCSNEPAISDALNSNIGIPESNEPNEAVMSSDSVKAIPKRCTVCGHILIKSEYKNFHVKRKCLLPDHQKVALTRDARMKAFYKELEELGFDRPTKRYRLLEFERQ
jgi:hypothetical protein